METDATRIAILENEVKELRRRQDQFELEVRADLKDILAAVNLIHKDINQVKGGWYGLFALLTLVGGIGAIVGRFVFRD